MKFTRPLAALLPLFLFACTNKATNATDNAELVGCYSYTTGKDTVALQITTATDSLKGMLTYHFFEKDRNLGTFAGRMLGDTLLADYSFEAEGMSSVRQVAFMKTDSGFVEGYGQSEYMDGKMVFTDRKNLQFKSDVRLNKTSCD